MDEVGRSDSDSIYRTPASPTEVAPAGDALAAYVGPKNADYYAELFDRFRNGGSKLSWSWPAFFVAAYWLLYRKMWLNALLYWVALPVVLGALSVGVALIAGELASTAFYYGAYLTITFILVPLFANYLYYRHAQGKVNKIAQMISSPERQSAELARIGGTSNAAIIVLIVISIALTGIIAAIAIPAYQDYTIRAQVSEGLQLSSTVKPRIEEYIATHNNAPADESDLNIDRATLGAGTFVSGIGVEDGTIIITYGNEAHAIIQGTNLMLVPEQTADAYIEWSCYSPDIEAKHLPAACR